MDKLKIQFIIILLLAAFPVLAQEEASSGQLSIMQIGQYQAEYNESTIVDDYHKVYKKDGQIVLSVFDTNQDGRDDLFLRYNGDMVLDLEARDGDGDGEFDTYVSLDAEENITEKIAPEYELQEVVLAPDPNPQSRETASQPAQIETPDIFVVGPPPTENKFNFSFIWVFAILAAGVAGFFVYKSKKNK